MQYCKKCLYPDTKPQIIFNEEGVCSACVNHEKKKKIDWDDKRQEFRKILDKYKSKDKTNYDCIIPVSGGKDSHYQTYVIKKEFGLNPLVINFHPQDQTELGKENLENLKKIGVDCIEFSPNPEVYLKLARFGLKELGDFQWPEHLGIFTIPVQMAVKFNIPLIIWGENPQLEYGQPTDVNEDTILDREWNEKNGGYFLDKIKPKDMVKYGFQLEELRPYIYPTDEEIRKVGVTGVFLGSYLKWDIFNQLDIVKKIGFKESVEKKEGTYDGWENLDVYFTVFHDYFKFLKYGFGRATDHASIEIRYGRITREEGLKLVKKNEGFIPRQYLKEFLEFADISMDEFLEICAKFTNKKIFKVDEQQNIVQDENGEVSKLKYDNS
ncbi:MAG: flagellin modification protein, PseA [Chloroflexi bacterium]|nr:flagellin modification protein, PseA [Chloroflexota bacterium]